MVADIDAPIRADMFVLVIMPVVVLMVMMLVVVVIMLVFMVMMLVVVVMMLVVVVMMLVTVVMMLVVVVMPVTGPVFFACISHTKHPPVTGSKNNKKNQKRTPSSKILF
jgi:hypothetical protein